MTRIIFAVRPRRTYVLAAALSLMALMPLLGSPVAAAGPYDWQVQQMYIAYYGRPGDPAGVDYWAERLAGVGGNWIGDVVDAFGSSAEYTERFGSLDEVTLIDNLFLQLYNRIADVTGMAYYMDLLNGGNRTGYNPSFRQSTLAQIALDIANGAQGEDQVILRNKLSIADYFTLAIRQSGAVYGTNEIVTAVDLLAAVDASAESIARARASLDPLGSHGYLELTVDTGARIDVSRLPAAVTSSYLLPDSTEVAISGNVANGALYFEDVAESSLVLTEPSDLRILFRITVDGELRLTTESSNPAHHLLPLTWVGGLQNNQRFSQSEVAPAQDAYGSGEPIAGHWTRSPSAYNGFLAVLAQELYARLYAQGAIIEGPRDAAELGEADWELTNAFSEPISVIFSAIYYLGPTMSWYDEDGFYRYLQSLWSPVDPDTGPPVDMAYLRRSFKIDLDLGQPVAMNLMSASDSAEVRATGIRDVVNFSRSQGDELSGWSVRCDLYPSGYCQSSSAGNGFSWVNFFVPGMHPSLVELEGTHSAFVLATFAETIMTGSFAESPSPGADGNPAPYIYTIPSVFELTVPDPLNPDSLLWDG